MIHPRDWYVEIDGQGPNLVLLHGLGASSFSWRHNRARLARHFRVITPDLPGHGRSPAPLDGDYRVEALVRGVLNFLDWHGITTAVLGGNSLGGGLSLLAARERPEQIAALVLLAPAAAMIRVPYAFYPLRLPVLGNAVASLLGPWFLPWFMRLVYHHPERLIPEAVPGYAGPYRDRRRRLALRQICRQLQVRPLGEIAALARRLTQPTLLIWGQSDRILPAAQGHWLKQHLPLTEFHLLPEVGHAPQEEAPEAVNKIIIDFLGHSLKNDNLEGTPPLIRRE
ncbi:MAG: alpha/beta hydrolase [Desulfobaccales bacterium]